MVSNLKAHSDLPWLVGGDLNEIFDHSEKKGGPPKAQAHIDHFRDAFLDCDLYDLGFTAYELMWCNYQQNGIVVEERLDRFCANTEWALLFPNATVSNVDCELSDHLPILLECRPNRRRGGSKRLFKFENMWVTNPACREVISRAWNSMGGANSINILIEKVDLCA